MAENRLNGRQICSDNKNPVSAKRSCWITMDLIKWDYKYLVLMASFCAYMLACIISSCFSVFFESMQTDLNLTKSQLGFIGALLSALCDLAGPISSAMTNRYGCRKTTIFGGLIAAFGVIASAFVEDFWLLSFLLGGVSGFGSSLVMVSSVVVVTYYFEEYPSLATGITISGASFGISIFTMIIIKLNEFYGRSGCFLILGGLFLNIIVCGGLFRPHDATRKAPIATAEHHWASFVSLQKPDHAKSVIAGKNSQSTTTLVNPLKSPRACGKEARGFSSDSCLSYIKDGQNKCDQRYRSLNVMRTPGNLVRNANSNTQESVFKTNISIRFPQHFGNVYYYKSLSNLNNRLKSLKALAPNQSARISPGIVSLDEKTANISSFSCPELSLNQVLQVDAIDRQLIPQSHHPDNALLMPSTSSSGSGSDEADDQEEDECKEYLKQTKVGTWVYRYLWKPAIQPLKFLVVSLMESAKLFTLFRFSVFAFCNFTLSFFYEAPFYFINSYMVENRHEAKIAGTVNVSVGIVCIFSSIIYGYLGDSKKINSIILYSVSLILCGILCCLIPPFINNYLVTLILMSLIGILISVGDVLMPIICVNLVGHDDFVNSYGLMCFCQGLASLAGPPCLGAVVDLHGFALSYYIIGIGIIFSGLILTTINCYSFIEKVEKTEDLDSSKEPINLSVQS